MRAILHILSLAVAAIKGRWRGLLEALALPCLGLALLSVLTHALSGGLSTVVLLVSLPLYVIVAVRVHKQILLEGASKRSEVGLNTFLQYFGASILVFLVTVPAILLAMVSFAASSGPLAYLAYALIAVSILAAFYLASRASLMLPERALDRSSSFSEIWSWSQHNGWRLTGALMLPPHILNFASQVLLWPLPPMGQAMVGAILNLPIMVFELALLSVAYRELRGRSESA